MNKEIVHIIQEYFKSQPIEKAWLFGSFSRGEETNDSDVDILVTFVKNAKIGFRFAGIICELESLLHRNVDMVVDGDLLPFASESVNRDKILIYERCN